MTELTISVPPALKQWIDERIAQGLYADTDDFVRTLLRRDQKQAIEDDAWLRAMRGTSAAARLNQKPEHLPDEILSGCRADRG